MLNSCRCARARRILPAFALLLIAACGAGSGDPDPRTDAGVLTEPGGGGGRDGGAAETDGGAVHDGGASADGGVAADGGVVLDGGPIADGGVVLDGGGIDPARCGVPLLRDGALDVDVPTVRIAGRIPLDGAPLPDILAGPTLSLVRANLLDGNEAGTFLSLAEVAAAGGAYEARVIPGDYELRYGYVACTEPRYPCQVGVRLRTVSLRRSGALDLDLRTIRITGRATLDGVAPPNATHDRGRIALRGGDGATGRLVDLNALASGGAYDVRIFPGIYALSYDNDDALARCASSPYPCQHNVPWRAGVVFAQSGVYDIPLRTVRITGRVTLDRAAPPAAAYHKGRVLVRGADGSLGTLANLQVLATGAYDTRVFAGDYELLYDNPDAEGACQGTPYPCAQRMPFRRGLRFTTDGALDVDVPTVRVTGRVTLDGAALPTAAYTRGDLHLRRTGVGGGTVVFAPLDRVAQASPASTYDVRVLPDTYDLLYDNVTTGSTCTGTPYPCQRRFVIRNATALNASGSLDLDLGTIRLTGRVTMDGAALPASTTSPGRIELRRSADPQSLGTLVELSRARQQGGAYEVRVFAETYDVLYTNPDVGSACVGSPYPCQERVVWRAQAPLRATGAFDVDLRPLRISGRVTMDGADLPAVPVSRRAEVFVVGADTSFGALIDLAAHERTYDVRLFSQRYNLYFGYRGARGVSCPQGTLPCVPRRLHGCETDGR